MLISVLSQFSWSCNINTTDVIIWVWGYAKKSSNNWKSVLTWKGILPIIQCYLKYFSVHSNVVAADWMFTDLLFKMWWSWLSLNSSLSDLDLYQCKSCTPVIIVCTLFQLVIYCMCTNWKWKKNKFPPKKHFKMVVEKWEGASFLWSSIKYWHFQISINFVNAAIHIANQSKPNKDNCKKSSSNFRNPDVCSACLFRLWMLEESGNYLTVKNVFWMIVSSFMSCQWFMSTELKN